MSAYSYVDIINDRLATLEPQIETAQIILDTLRYNQPWTKAQSEVWYMTWDRLQGLKNWRKQLRNMLRDLSEFTA